MSSLGENILKMNHFWSKKLCITNILVCSKLKSWWHFLIILYTRKKNLILHDNILEFKIHFELKIILIQQLDERDWLKLIYIEYIIYIFFDNFRASCLWFIKCYQKKKKIELLQCLIVKYLPSYMVMIFFYNKSLYIYCFKCPKTHF
jgi:hypothetical protein